MVTDRRRPGTCFGPWSSPGGLLAPESRLDGLITRQMRSRFSNGERIWIPPVDIFERDGTFVMRAETPGTSRDDIDISIVGNALVIKGEKKTDSEVKEDSYYHNERVYGRFYRSIRLPGTIDADRIQASYNDGVLEIIVPKEGGLKPKKITLSPEKKLVLKRTLPEAEKSSGKTASKGRR